MSEANPQGEAQEGPSTKRMRFGRLKGAPQG